MTFRPTHAVSIGSLLLLVRIRFHRRDGMVVVVDATGQLYRYQRSTLQTLTDAGVRRVVSAGPRTCQKCQRRVRRVTHCQNCGRKVTQRRQQRRSA